ncbi:MAG TPA: hypothetical protein VKX17_27590 [Planctomycetota bacterium]|nr:hypothetical protein [Planctomycetota bacterium]
MLSEWCGGTLAAERGVKQYLASIILFAIAAHALGADPVDAGDFRALMQEVRWDSSLGLSIKMPALEEKLAGATAAYWLKGLADTRPVIEQTAAEKQRYHEPDEWRVCDVVYYFYERTILQPEQCKLDHDRFTQAERSKFIEAAVAALKKCAADAVPEKRRK